MSAERAAMLERAERQVIRDARMIQSTDEQRASRRVGVLYLLHFDRPLHHARHYLGFCSSYEGLESRFSYHASGSGSRLLRAVGRNGWHVVRLWKGSRDDERRLKRRKESPALCPECSAHVKPVKGLEGIAL